MFSNRGIGLSTADRIMTANPETSARTFAISGARASAMEPKIARADSTAESWTATGPWKLRDRKDWRRGSS
ncbi:hypothetical protein C8R44DRAFT_759993 [Mycena epipterygia]|nr:hypothetical protein C8R44DRAFT_759993 [Mycena epipterygia]